MTLHRDPAFAGVKALVIARTGHQYYADKDEQLAERIAHRMAERGDPDAEAYLARIADPGADEWPFLESAVTINETFFFRFAEQFDALRRVVLPAMIARRRAERRLRIWSVGCSTGAEPHSIAILLHDLLGDAIAGWRIALLGTDIDADALEVARRAEYSSWALRTVDEGERLRLFDRRGDRYRLKERYRGLARFERHNLLSLLEPAAALQFDGYDLILCRNVLIYFSQDDATAIVGALASRLDSEGLLFVGHAEVNPGFDAVARPTPIGDVIAYRNSDGLPPDERPPAPPPETVPTPPAAALPRQRPAAPPPPPPSPAPDPPAASPPQPLRIDAQAHLDAAMEALADGGHDAASAAFRRALYLDPQFVMAHYLFGRHLLAIGADAEGRRSLRNALRIAAALPHGVALAGGDGMTADGVVAATRATLGETG